MRNFSKKPLVEAIMEIKFSTTDEPLPSNRKAGELIPFEVDPNFKIFFARFYDLVISNNLYPEYHKLPQAEIPEELAMHIVQHRFTSEGGNWPLVQLGPGVITLNETDNYCWNDFSRRAIEIFEILNTVHPKREDLKITHVTLRYINALPFSDEQDIVEFLNENMKLNINFDDELLNKTNLNKSSDVFRLTNTFRSEDPECLFVNSIDIGEKDDSKAIIWELFCRSKTNRISAKSLNEFELWLDGAHKIIDRWFMETVKGNLEKGFD